MEDRKTEGQKDRWKDGQTLFHWTLLATIQGPIITKRNGDNK